MTFEQLDLLLRQVSEGMDGTADWPPPQEKECMAVATLDLLRLQVPTSSSPLLSVSGVTVFMTLKGVGFSLLDELPMKVFQYFKARLWWSVMCTRLKKTVWLFNVCPGSRSPHQVRVRTDRAASAVGRGHPCRSQRRASCCWGLRWRRDPLGLPASPFPRLWGLDWVGLPPVAPPLRLKVKIKNAPKMFLFLFLCFYCFEVKL